VTGVLAVLSGGTLLVLLGLFYFSQNAPVNPLRLIRIAFTFCILPYLALRLIRAAFACRAFVEGGALVLEGRDERIEIPVASIAAAHPWRIPLPASGITLELQSGRRFSRGLCMEDPAQLIDVLASVSGNESLRRVAADPWIVYASERAEILPGSYKRLLVKFPIFALVPTLPLFRVHQLIAYGGAFGEYQQYGLGPYLAGFAIYWASLTIYLLLYAAALRVPVELVCAGAALASPGRAGDVRRVAERLAAWCFFVGVPAVVILRFIPW